MMLKSILRFTRAHTVPLEAIPAIIGASLATGEVFSLEVAAWGFFGVLYHLAGYGMNSYSDWKNGYDKSDPNKEHHPLNTGKMQPEFAKKLVVGLLVITFSYAIAITGAENLTSVAGVISVGVISGVAYNEFGKETWLKPIPISIAHTTVFVAPFVALGGSLSNPLFIAGTIFVFLWVMFQIAFSGEIKDFKQEEENFLKHMGAIDLPMVIAIPPDIRRTGYALKVAPVFLGVATLRHTGAPWGGWLVYTVMAFFCFFFLAMLLESGSYIRDRRIAAMSKVEMLTAGMFCFMFSGTLPGYQVMAVVVVAYVYTPLMNSYLWGSPGSVDV